MGHSHNVKDSDANFTINPTTMEIVNNSAKNKMMQGDHNSEIYSFEITQIVEGHEMILCNKIRIHFINISSDKADQSKGVANAENIRIDSAKNMLVFEWKVSGDATKYQGSLNFRIEFACTDENNVRTYAKWTEIHKGITIGEGFDNAEGYIEEHKDILAQWKADLESEIKNYEDLEKKIPTKMSQLEQDVELGSKAFIINVTGSAAENNPNAYVLDKTFEEIKQAYDNGRELKCILHCDVLLGGEDGEIIPGDGINLDLNGFNDEAFIFDQDIDGVSYKLAAFNGGVELCAVLSYLHAYYGTDQYTPTRDYHPATKKYVDDAVQLVHYVLNVYDSQYLDTSPECTMYYIVNEELCKQISQSYDSSKIVNVTIIENDTLYQATGMGYNFLTYLNKIGMPIYVYVFVSKEQCDAFYND